MGCCAQANQKGKGKSTLPAAPGKKDIKQTEEQATVENQPQDNKTSPQKTDPVITVEQADDAKPQVNLKPKTSVDDPKIEEDMTDSDDEMRHINDIALSFLSVRKANDGSRAKKIKLIQWVDDISQKFIVGDYVIDEGDAGKICRGKNKETGKQVLIKCCRKKKAVFNEIKAAQKNMEIYFKQTVAHPDFTYAMNIFHDNKYYYIITDYYEGGPLSEHLEEQKNVENRKLSERNTQNIVYQILKTLNYLHGKGNAINDLKLSNLMLQKKFIGEASPEIKVLIQDCGTTQYWSPEDGFSKLDYYLNNQTYKAPELVANSNSYISSASADIWALGIITIELLSNDIKTDGDLTNLEKPFDIKKSLEGIERSDQCEDFISKCLDKKFQTRSTVRQLLNHPWISESGFQQTKVLDANKLKLMVSSLKDLKTTEDVEKSLGTMMMRLIINDHEIENMVAAFQWLDKDGDGTVTPAEMNQADMDFGDIFGFGENWKEVFEQMDTSSDGKIDFTEFLMLAVDKSKVFTYSNIIKVFKVLDKNGDGTVDVNEFKSIIPQEVTEDKVGKQQIQKERDIWTRLMKKYDADGDSKLNLDEFQNLIQMFVRENTTSM